MFFKKKNKIKKPLFRRIINAFIYTGVALIILFIIAFALSQTSSFRQWLKEVVTEQVNSATNGTLEIESIDGTVFTSLILNNLNYKLYEDTLFRAEKIELKTSPLKIFFKVIHIRKIEIDNAVISLIKYDNGQLNISKITAPPEEKIVQPDTLQTETASGFDWAIEVADLILNNVSFNITSQENLESNRFYLHPDFNDFRVGNINLRLSAFADISRNEFQLNINEFTAEPNLYDFKLNDLSGNILIIEDQAAVTDLNIVTGKSNISVSAGVSGFNLLGDNKNKSFEDADLNVTLAATDFNFDDLTTFIEATSLLKGSITTHLAASGSLRNLKVERIKLNFGTTNLELNGRVKDIPSGDNMFINTTFTNTTINQKDVNELLHTIDLPVFEGLDNLMFDTLYFKGKPTVFDAAFAVTTGKGKIDASAFMDITKDEMEYNYIVKTKNLNLLPVAGINTKLNSTITMQGKGTSPSKLITDIKMIADNSVIENNLFQTLQLNASAGSGKIESTISFISGKLDGRINSVFDFSDEENPGYNFDAAINGFNIKNLDKESSSESSINISINGEGENFGADNLILFAVLEIDSSYYNGFNVDSTRAIIDIGKNDNQRVVNIISDLFDITLTGNYRLDDLIKLVAVETASIGNTIESKINRIQPPELINTQLFSDNSSGVVERGESLLLTSDINLDYLVEFKKFELLSLLLNNSEIEIDGLITGDIKTFEDSLSMRFNSEVKYFKYWDGKELYFVSDFNLGLTVEDLVSDDTFNNFLTKMDLTARRIFAGVELDDVYLNLQVIKSLAAINSSVQINKKSEVQLTGRFDFAGRTVNALLDTLMFGYNNYKLTNNGRVKFNYSDNNLEFTHFNLSHGKGLVTLLGNFSTNGQQNLTLQVSDFDAKEISKHILELPAERRIDAVLNLDAKYTGLAANPEIKLNFSLDSIKLGKRVVNSLVSNVEYENKKLIANITLFDINKKNVVPALNVDVSLPVDLSIDAEEFFVEDKNLKVNIFADSVDLHTAANHVPYLKNLQGLLYADLKLGGTFSNITSRGSLSLNKVNFLLEPNNLQYDFNLDAEFIGNQIKVPQFTLANSKVISEGGVITGSGFVNFINNDVTDVEFRANGELKLLGKSTRAINPSLYGDIAIRTVEDITYKLNENENFVYADLILQKGANLTYSPTQSAFSNETDKFTYVFEDLSKVNKAEREIDSLITISITDSSKLSSSSNIPFDIQLKIRVEDEAKMEFVLSREFQQSLIAYLGGELEYIVKDEEPFAKGELVLLEGSKLNFIKSFQAEGTVKFLSELDNPYLDVTATYQNYYNPDTLNTGLNNYEVQVRISLEGPAKSISANFIRNEDNIAVYRRQTNRGQFELDPTKSGSDAMFFIIIGKFPEDATAQESNLAVSTAASLAGSIVGGFLNEWAGDFIRSVEVSQKGSETKFSLIGKAGSFRYEIGGTSQVFQDLSRTNVKIEYPIPFTPGLLLRLERREPVFESSTYSEMINELGLKYSFEF